MIRILILGLFLFGCRPDNYSGYIVCKEYTPEHECHSKVEVVREAAFIPPPRVVVAPPHHHKTQKAEYKIYIANRDFVRNINVSEATYMKFKVTDKVKIENSKITKED